MADHRWVQRRNSRGGTPPPAWPSPMRKHSDPYLTVSGRWTLAACGCGWSRWYGCGPAGASVGWALHVAVAGGEDR